MAHTHFRAQTWHLWCEVKRVNTTHHEESCWSDSKSRPAVRFKIKRREKRTRCKGHGAKRKRVKEAETPKLIHTILATSTTSPPQDDLMAALQGKSLWALSLSWFAVLAFSQLWSFTSDIAEVGVTSVAQLCVAPTKHVRVAEWDDFGYLLYMYCSLDCMD